MYVTCLDLLSVYCGVPTSHLSGSNLESLCTLPSVTPAAMALAVELGTWSLPMLDLPCSCFTRIQNITSKYTKSFGARTGPNSLHGCTSNAFITLLSLILHFLEIGILLERPPPSAQARACTPCLDWDAHFVSFQVSCSGLSSVAALSVHCNHSGGQVPQLF